MGNAWKKAEQKDKFEFCCDDPDIRIHEREVDGYHYPVVGCLNCFTLYQPEQKGIVDDGKLFTWYVSNETHANLRTHELESRLRQYYDIEESYDMDRIRELRVATYDREAAIWMPKEVSWDGYVVRTH